MSESLVFLKLKKSLQKYDFIQIFLSESLVFCEGKSDSLRKNEPFFIVNFEWRYSKFYSKLAVNFFVVNFIVYIIVYLVVNFI